MQEQTEKARGPLGEFILKKRAQYQPEPGEAMDPKGLTRKAVAIRGGISYHILRKLEEGETRSTTTFTLKRISEALRLSEEETIGLWKAAFEVVDLK